MPNGYTAGVIDGTYDAIDYVQHAARGFGIAVAQRDSGPGPVERRTVSDYRTKSVQESKDRLNEWLAMTDAERRREYDEYVGGINKRNKESLRRASENRVRISDVRDVILATPRPVNPDVNQMIDGMVKWLDETEEWDGKAYVSHPEPYDEWLVGHDNMLRRSLNNSIELLDEELERVASQNQAVDDFEAWVETLKNHI